MKSCLNPYVLVYLVAIVAANFSICIFGPVSAPINAFLFIGLDLTLRDKLHDNWMGPGLGRRMGALIVAGSLISYVLSLFLPGLLGGPGQAEMGRVALASMLAFGGAALADALVYTLLLKRGFLVRANGSNLAGAALDSLLFPTLAFGAFLPLIILGQFAAKAAGGFVWSLILKPRRAKTATA